MNLKADPENNPIVLNSDIEQSLETKLSDLEFAIVTLKDIIRYCNDLTEAKALSKYALSRLEH